MEGRKLSQALKKYCLCVRGLGTYDAIGLTHNPNLFPKKST
jgi:hypothetical protein